MDIFPRWDRTSRPDLFVRTETQYTKIPIEAFLKNINKSEFFEELLQSLPFGTYIAGGYMLSLLENKEDQAGDVDLWFNNPLAFEEAYNVLLSKGYKLNENFNKQWTGSKVPCIQMECKDKKKIQLIKNIWFTDAEHVIDCFDFNLVQFATDLESFVFNPISLLSLPKKTIELHRILNNNLKKRLAKYKAKGYIVPDELEKNIDKLTIEEGEKNPNIYSIYYPTPPPQPEFRFNTYRDRWEFVPLNTTVVTTSPLTPIRFETNLDDLYRTAMTVDNNAIMTIDSVQEPNPDDADPPDDDPYF